jgi:hypothetical protein
MVPIAPRGESWEGHVNRFYFGLRFVAGVIALLLLPMAATQAAGNLASRPTDLALTVDRNLKPSATDYQVETGKYYRWTIRNDAPGEEMQIMAPELWRNSYLEHISFGDNEVFPLGIYAVEIDEDQEVKIFFIPLRPGDYDWYIKGQEQRGLKGKFIVR